MVQWANQTPDKLSKERHQLLNLAYKDCIICKEQKVNSKGKLQIPELFMRVNL